MDTYLNAPITTLSGVGESRKKAYAKLGIFTIRDLVYHFPRAFEHRGNIRPLATVENGERCACILTVSTEPRVSRVKRGMSLLKFKAFEESEYADGGVCEITFFNQDYLRSTFPIGSTFRFYGKVEKKGNRYVMTSPAFEPYREGRALPPLYPVYPLTEAFLHHVFPRQQCNHSRS